ncbi:MAG: LapA family protein, partial [Armatimonadota bacterium]|nr:LapA family protein [Armatimonadota bacterium]
VTLRFVAWSLSTTLALAVIGAAVLGGLIVYVASVVSHGALRGRLRAAEARLREWERERATSGQAPGSAPRS